MRTKLTLIVILAIVSLNGYCQSRSDTLNYLMKIGDAYLTAMYENRNFDSASKMWDSDVLKEAEIFYSRKKIEAKDDSSIIRLIKSAYTKYYSNLTSFIPGSVTAYTFRGKEDNRTEVRLLYHCSEKLKRKKDIRIVLHFFSYDEGKTWKISDSQIIEITNRFT